MGYTPRIIICHDDLKKHEEDIQMKAMGLSKQPVKPELKEPYQILHRAVSQSPVNFRDKRLVIIQPDLTDINTRVRSLLNRLDIYFTVDY